MNNHRGPTILDNGLGTIVNPGAYFGWGQASPTIDPDSSGPRMYSGTGNPNGVVPAPLNSFWLRSDSPILYQNTDGLLTWVVVVGGGGPGGSANVFVLRPGTPGNGVTVFETWVDLYAVISPGGVPLPYPVIIYFDDILIAPVGIQIGPAGNYVLPIGTFFFPVNFNPAGLGTLVEFQDGVTFNRADGTVGFGRVTQSLTLRSLSTAPILTVTAGPPAFQLQSIIMFQGPRLQASGTAPFVDFVGVSGVVALQEGGKLDTGAVPCVRVSGGQQIIIPVGLTGQITANTLEGGVADAVFLIITGSSAQIDLAQPGFLGVFGTLYLTDAFKVGYTPTVLADWSGVAPVDVGVALDRIAALLTPIP